MNGGGGGQGGRSSEQKGYKMKQLCIIWKHHKSVIMLPNVGGLFRNSGQGAGPCKSFLYTPTAWRPSGAYPDSTRWYIGQIWANIKEPFIPNCRRVPGFLPIISIGTMASMVEALEPNKIWWARCQRHTPVTLMMVPILYKTITASLYHPLLCHLLNIPKSVPIFT